MSAADAQAAAEAYKGTASIIQGVLIAISAVVAVCGYFAQARLNRRERNRQHNLEETRQLLKNIVGPAQALAYSGWCAWLNFNANFVYKGQLERTDLLGIYERVTGNPEAFNMHMAHTDYMDMDRFVSSETEAHIRANPTSPISVEYRRFVARLLKDFLRPLAEKVRDFNIYPVPTVAEFKRRYPCFANSFSLRKTIFIRTLSFVSELDHIVTVQWEQEGDFTNLFPISETWCTAITGYLAAMVTDLKAKIEALTDSTADQDNLNTSPLSRKEQKRMARAFSKANETESSKYRTSAPGGIPHEQKK